VRGLALIVAMTVAVAMAVAPVATGASADRGGPGSVAAKAKKKCKKGKARFRRKCVKRCPSGYVKKRSSRGPVCARKPKPQPLPQPQPQPTPPAPGGNPAPNPDQVQLTRDDAAGQSALAVGDLLLERAQFGASGRTAEYDRISLYSNSQFRLSIRDWNDVSGEIPRSCSEGNWVFKEGYTYAVQGGGTVVKLGITASGGSGDEVFIFHNADPNAVYLVVNGQAVRFEKNPNMNQGC
jgi:hypothetical protein